MEASMFDFDIDPRWCPGCKQNRVARSFYKNKRTGSPTGYCKPCTKLRNKVYYEKHKKTTKKDKTVENTKDFCITCKYCGQSKQNNEFYRDNTTKLGYRTVCKQCITEAKKMRYKYINNKKKKEKEEALNNDLLWNNFMPDTIRHLN